jgi:hypothetical protein
VGGLRGVDDEEAERARERIILLGSLTLLFTMFVATGEEIFWIPAVATGTFFAVYSVAGFFDTPRDPGSQNDFDDD